MSTMNISSSVGFLRLEQQSVREGAGEILLRSAAFVLRYGLVLLILWFGVFKFTPSEAQAIQPLVAHSPLLSWLYAVTGVRGASRLIGIAEITIALLIAARPWSSRASAVGSIGATLMFLTTLSFLITTPGSWAVVDSILVPAGAGSFLIKDLLLLGAALWTAGEALLANAALGRGQRR
jgi:reactive chlorine resistance protein C